MGLPRVGYDWATNTIMQVSLVTTPGPEMLVWKVQTLPGAWGPISQDLGHWWPTGGPLLAGRLPEELPDQCAVAT